MTKGLSRREFLRDGAVGLTAGGVCLCGLGSCATLTGVGDTEPIAANAYSVAARRELRIDLGKVRELGRVGGSVKIIDPSLPKSLIVVRTGEEEYACTSLECPHRGTEVEYDAEAGVLECASMGSSTFGLDGRNLDGPADEPLRSFRVSLEEGTLVVALG